MNISARTFRNTKPGDIVPDYAKALKTYRDDGEFIGQSDRVELSQAESQRMLDGSFAALKRFKALDESDQDLNKGQVGDVKLASSVSGEYTQAQFTEEGGRTTLLVVENEPSTHYGATRASFTNFGPTAVESAQVTNNNGIALHSSLTHVDYRLSTSGPTELGKDPISVTLTPRAVAGYQQWQDQVV